MVSGKRNVEQTDPTRDDAKAFAAAPVTHLPPPMVGEVGQVIIVRRHPGLPAIHEVVLRDVCAG